MKKIWLLAILATLVGFTFYRMFPTEKLSMVQQFTNAIKSNNPEIIANYVVYPLSRANPVPDVHNKQEFIERYNSLFDDDLKKIIINSNENDWSVVGSKGIMLNDGIIWLNEEGKLIAINGFSEKESKYANKWEETDKSTLNPLLRKYHRNINIFETQKYLGRIDEIAGDKEYQYSYRLALWHQNEKMSEKPIIVVDNGTVEYLGSSNNHIYSFKSGETTYTFEVTYIGSEDLVPYQLIISKDNNQLSIEAATLMK